MTSDPATTAVRVDLGSRGYDVHITSGDSSGLGAFARARAAGRLAFVVSDEHVSVHAESAADALAAAGFRPVLSVLPSGERQKSLAVAAHLYDNLAELGADRTTLVVAVGCHS
jgi:3-dehydroquinate synthase